MAVLPLFLSRRRLLQALGLGAGTMAVASTGLATPSSISPTTTANSPTVTPTGYRCSDHVQTYYASLKETKHDGGQP
ncbi:MAG: twin-arginine translocation signal domain-containing protein [Ferrimonas sp.]